MTAPGTATDDERMRMALELAGEHPPPEAESFLPSRRVSTWGRGIPLILVAVAVAVVIGYLLARGDGPRDRDAVPGWRLVTGWVLFVTGFAAIIVGFVRTRGQSRFRRSRERNRPLEVLTVAQRRDLLRQVQGRADTVPAHLPLTRRVAQGLVGAQTDVWVTAGIVALFTGNALRSDSRGYWLFVGFLVLLIVVSAPYATRQARRARAFLAAHPAPTPEAAP